MKRLAVVLPTIVLAVTTVASAEPPASTQIPLSPPGERVRVRGDSLSGRIAFLRLTDGFWQVWTMNADGSDQRQVTRTPTDKVHVAWFPGNAKILHHTNKGETFVLELAAGKERRLLEGLSVTDAAVSPDGRRLAYGLPPEDLVKGKTSLWVSDLDGKDRRKVAGGPGNDALAPAWIEEGVEAASRVVGAGFIPPASGAGAARRAAQEEWPLLFRQCLMLNHMEARHDFWVARFDDGALLAAADGGAPFSAPAESGVMNHAPTLNKTHSTVRDPGARTGGDVIASSSPSPLKVRDLPDRGSGTGGEDKGGGEHVGAQFIAPRSRLPSGRGGGRGGEHVGAQFIAPAVKPVQGDDEAHKFDQTISSKGIVAYSSRRSGSYEIWTIPLEGGKPTQVTRLESYAGNPSWSPDGSRIAFDSTKDDVQQIYVIGADGKGLVRLTTSPDPSRKPVWTR